MREIEFRGKRVDNGEWVYGFIIKSPFDQYYIYVQVDKRHTNWKHEPLIEVIPETLGQYTGLNDKNGKKIFEGDAINIEFPNTIVTNAIVESIGASFYGSTNADAWELDHYYKIEVIGNIFDKECNDENFN